MEVAALIIAILAIIIALGAVASINQTKASLRGRAYPPAPDATVRMTDPPD